MLYYSHMCLCFYAVLQPYAPVCLCGTTAIFVLYNSHMCLCVYAVLQLCVSERAWVPALVQNYASM